MTDQEYKKLTLVEMKKRKWRTVVEMRNGWMVIPAYTPVDIGQKRHGDLGLTGPPCKHCGVRVSITRVSPASVEEVHAVVGTSKLCFHPGCLKIIPSPRLAEDIPELCSACLEAQHGPKTEFQKREDAFQSMLYGIPQKTEP